MRTIDKEKVLEVCIEIAQNGLGNPWAVLTEAPKVLGFEGVDHAGAASEVFKAAGGSLVAWWSPQKTKDDTVRLFEDALFAAQTSA